MIKVSKLTDYAVMALGALASHGGSVSATDLSADIGLSVSTVAKVLKLLAKAGIISGARGATGGYRMKADPDKLSIAQIVTAVDGPVRVTDSAAQEQQCTMGGLCGMKGRWGPVNRAIISALGGVTLADMMKPLNNKKVA